jgi:hypothetical protein
MASPITSGVSRLPRVFTALLLTNCISSLTAQIAQASVAGVAQRAPMAR